MYDTNKRHRNQLDHKCVTIAIVILVNHISVYYIWLTIPCTSALILYNVTSFALTTIDLVLNAADTALLLLCRIQMEI